MERMFTFGPQHFWRRFGSQDGDAVMAHLARNLPPNTEIVRVGVCERGRFLYLLLQKGWDGYYFYLTGESMAIIRLVPDRRLKRRWREQRLVEKRCYVPELPAFQACGNQRVLEIFNVRKLGEEALAFEDMAWQQALAREVCPKSCGNPRCGANQREARPPLILAPPLMTGAE